ncbi:MAG TPA: four helix bundle protein [Verrucomicrobiae bacterium]|jgi:four helix bundle protein|nr:four helix bundle protein [Verrucomicrobiae bacterium]
MKSSIVKDKSYAFALRTITLARWLKAQKEFEIAGQILRSGTAIGSNVEEALAGISRADFIAKMSIASKEARETHYWLRLLRDSNIVANTRITPLENENLELIRVLTAIVKTSQATSVNSKLRIKN